MPRKAGSSTTTRRKKTDAVPEVPAQGAPQNTAPEIVAAPEPMKTLGPQLVKEAPVKDLSANDAGKNGKAFAAAAASGGSVSSASNGNAVHGSIEDEIRRRAYEIYQQRARNGQHAGDQNQDWLIAEREVRSRFTGSRTTSA
jgi:hypothetical protein